MKKKIILIVAGVIGLILIVGGSVAGALFLTGALEKEPAAAEALPVDAGPPPPEPVFYYNIQPEFVVNFQRKTRDKFLMIEMVVATHDEKVPDVLTEHDPELRNSLLMLLAEQESQVLKTAIGKQALRDAAMERISEILARQNLPEAIHDVFITRLVIQ